MKNITCLLVLSVIIFCSCTPDPLFLDTPPIIDKTRYLKFVYEDDNLVKSFEYDENRLTKQIVYSDYGISSFHFIYSDLGVVESAYNKERNITRDLVFQYQDTLIKQFKVWINDQLRYRIIFDRDEQGRIIRMSWIHFSYGFVKDVIFEWEGQNISRYESTSYDGFDNPTYVYEYTSYDQLWNPYAEVYETVGFNFIDFIPLTKNNWIELVYYKKGDYKNKVTCVNKFSYSGRYPYVNEFVMQDDQDRNQIYVEYNYKNTLH